MKKLKKVGFFKELPHGDDGGGSLVAIANGDISNDRANVISYLENGCFLIIAPTIVIDVLSDEGRPIGTLAIQTDGEWAWPSDLAYYVGHYNVSLPSEFIQYMHKNKWTIGSININDLMLSL